MKKNKINIILIILVLTIYHLGYHYFSTSLVAQERRTAVKIIGDIVLNCGGQNIPSAQTGGAGQNTTLNCTGKFTAAGE
jgi:hypothetical protein